MVKYNEFYYLCDMEKKYISESHRKYSEACQKEVAEMSMNPLTAEEKEEQMRRNKRLSFLRATQRNKPTENTIPSFLPKGGK